MLKKYYELTKPERTITNVLTAVAGYLFASRWRIAWQPFIALLVGSLLVIASACVFNNIIDRRLDQKMARTRQRVLATGQVSTGNALMLAGLLGIVGFWALVYTNWLTFGAGVCAFVGYVFVYGFAKRHTVHGTLIGTIPGGASLVAGYTAVTGRLDRAAGLLFIIMAAWQMAHFFAIAIYRLDDYRTAGVPVWPVRYGVHSTKKQIIGYVAIFTVACAVLALFGRGSYSFLIVMVGLGLYWLWRGAQGLHRNKQVDDATWARGMFGFSLVVVLALPAMLAVGRILP